MPNYSFIDLTGQTFNRLFVIERAENSGSGRVMWKCQCSCGNITIVFGTHLRAEHTQSCGCLQKERVKQSRLKHGLSQSSEFKIWDGILARCCNPNNKHFKNYGGRGITVCNEWKNSFMAFFTSMGKRPSKEHSIERIDNDKSYCPKNCKWATRKEQMNNRRSNHKITIHNITMNMLQWADFTGIKYKTVLYRLKKGWSIEKALFCPIKKK